MGILNVLGKIGKGALGMATGGASNAIFDVLGGGAKASSDSRMDQAQLQSQMNALNNRTALDAATFNRDLPGVQAGQVVRGDALGAMQNAPVSDPRAARFSGGGLRPSLLGADSRQAGSALKQQALAQLMRGGGQFTPTMSAIPNSGILEKLGAGAGIFGGIQGAIQEAGRLAEPKPKKKPTLIDTLNMPTGPFASVKF